MPLNIGEVEGCLGKTMTGPVLVPHDQLSKARRRGGLADPQHLINILPRRVAQDLSEPAMVKAGEHAVTPVSRITTTPLSTVA